MGDIVINPMNFITNLKYMGFGMLGIFVVIGLIIATTVLLNHVTKPRKKDK